MNITAVVGARPNFVKIAPIAAELRHYPEFCLRLIHTGQHHDIEMSESFFAALGIPDPDENLGVHGGTTTTQTVEIMLRLEPIFVGKRPDLVIVVGDVNSTLAAALVAVRLGIPVVHVEAGLRSFDRTMPEEVNRVLTDAIAHLLFTTEPSAKENLMREGIALERIHFVGNVMIDTLFRFRDHAAQSQILQRLGLTPGNYATLTLHRPSNVDEPEAFRRILAAVVPIQREVPVVFPVHPRTRRHLTEFDGEAASLPGLVITNPLPYLDFLQLMANARCVLTDSGGIQEETTALGIPCLTLRTTTERPITVTQGTNRVVGVDPDRIHAAWREIAAGRWPVGRLPELWDGKAAERIVRVLLEWAG